MELCAGTLEDVCNRSVEYEGPALPSNTTVLYEIACGLNYIHSMNLVHRNIKPSNILISLTYPVLIKISDFGSSKPIDYEGLFKNRGVDSTEHWRAPECLLTLKKMGERGSAKSDIFSAGLVFFYFITRGVHPFGDPYPSGDDPWLVAKNISENNPVNLASK